MRPECYPTLVALEAYGLECLQESLVFRIEQAVRRMCQCIRRCILFGEAPFSDSKQPTFFLISYGLSASRILPREFLSRNARQIATQSVDPQPSQRCSMPWGSPKR